MKRGFQMLERRSIALLFASGVAAVAACHSSGDEDLSPAPPTPATGTSATLPSELSSPPVYVAKVKNILVGLPATDEEVKAVEADPKKLATLIDGWMALP